MKLPGKAGGGSSAEELVEQLRGVLLSAALVLSPLSYTIKTVYDLQLTWVDPTLIIGAAAAVLPPWSWRNLDPRLRNLSLAALIFLGVYWLAAMKAAMVWRYPEGEVYREPVRTGLGVLLCVACIRTMRTPAALRRAAVLLGWVAVAEVIFAAYILVAWAVGLPLPEAWRNYVGLYWLRQSIYAGGVVLPRLGGTFIESPPFALYVLGALMVLRLARRSAARDNAAMPGLWMDAILCFGLAGSLSTQVLVGAALWGSIGFVEGVISPSTQKWRRWLYGAAIAVLMAVVATGAYYKAVTGVRPDKEYGTSVGERRAHATLAWQLFEDAPALGVGPGQFGEVEWRRSFGMYDRRVSPLSLFHELLADTGALGIAAAAVFFGLLLALLLQQRAYWSAAAVAGLVAADLFQGNWRWPIVFIALGAVVSAAILRIDRPVVRAP